MFVIQSPPYHLATVVADLESAQANCAKTLGLTWGRHICHAIRFDTVAGVVPVDLRLAYSLEGPPHVELIQQRPGPIYGNLGLHHAAYWVDDVPSASARLEGAGWIRECVPVDEHGHWVGGAYHRSPDGLRVEIVSQPLSGPKLARYLAGGDYA